MCESWESLFFSHFHFFFCMLKTPKSCESSTFPIFLLPTFTFFFFWIVSHVNREHCPLPFSSFETVFFLFWELSRENKFAHFHFPILNSESCNENTSHIPFLLLFKCHHPLSVLAFIIWTSPVPKSYSAEHSLVWNLTQWHFKTH